MGRRGKQQELVVAGHGTGGIGPHLVEENPGPAGRRIVPRVHVQRGDVEAVARLDVAEVLPEGILWGMGHEIAPVVRRRSGHLGDLGNRQHVREGPDRNVRDRDAEVEIGCVGQVFVAEQIGREFRVALDTRRPVPGHQRDQLVGPPVPGAEIRHDPAGRLGNRGGVVGMPHGGKLHLVLALIGAAVGADLAGGPGLGGDPGHRIVAVVPVVRGGGEFAVGLVLPPDILDHDRIPVAGKPRGDALLEAEGLLVVGRPDQHGWKATGEVRREIPVGGQLHAVPHRGEVTELDPDRVGAFGRVVRYRRTLGGQCFGGNQRCDDESQGNIQAEPHWEKSGRGNCKQPQDPQPRGRRGAVSRGGMVPGTAGNYRCLLANPSDLSHADSRLT